MIYAEKFTFIKDGDTRKQRLALPTYPLNSEHTFLSFDQLFVTAKQQNSSKMVEKVQENLNTSKRLLFPKT